MGETQSTCSKCDGEMKPICPCGSGPLYCPNCDDPDRIRPSCSCYLDYGYTKPDMSE